MASGGAPQAGANGEGCDDGSVGEPDDPDIDGELERVDRWAAEVRVAAAVGAHDARAGWLTRQAGGESTLRGVLQGLGERRRPIVVQLVSGRRHRGTVTRIGRDVVGMRLTTGTDVLLAMAALLSVRTPPGEVVEAGAGADASPTDLAAELRRLADDRVRVQLRPTSGPDAVAGTLAGVGHDLLTLRLEGGGLAYVPLASVAEVSVVESG